MRSDVARRLALLPPVVRHTGSAAAMVALLALFAAWNGAGPGRAVFAAAFAVVGFTVLIAICRAVYRLRLRPAAGLSDPSDARRAVHASFGGPVPEDEDVREAAARVVRRRLELERGQVLGSTVLGLLYGSLVLWVVPGSDPAVFPTGGLLAALAAYRFSGAWPTDPVLGRLAELEAPDTPPPSPI